LLCHYAAAEVGEAELQDIKTQPEVRPVVETFLEICRRKPIENLDDYKAAVNEVKARTGAKGKKLFHPIRLAVTGATSGLELESLIPLLDKGSRLPLPVPVLSCTDRLTRFL